MSAKLNPKAKIDLHAHSNRSDGTDSPDQVIRDAAAAGLDIVALTDHDTTSGWDAAREAARAAGIGFIPGIEVTSRANFLNDSGERVKFSVHMLAYLPDPENQALAVALQRSVEGRLERLQQITELLAEDYDLVWEDVLEQIANGKTAGRPAIADAMVAKGIFEERTPFFSIVSPGTKYYVPTRTVPTPEEAIQLIRGAGGVPVIAHPMARVKNWPADGPFPVAHFEAMIEAGLGGFEVYHRDVPESVRNWLTGLAQERDLVLTGSSDYHGTGKQNRLGENLTPVWALEQILQQGNSQLALL